MKECLYCGRSSDDTAIHCRECGSTELRILAQRIPGVKSRCARAGGRQWLGAILLGVTFFAAFEVTVISTTVLLHLRGFYGFTLATLITMWVPLPFWLLLANLLCAPLMRVLGLLKYYSPLFLVTAFGPSRIYLHGATLYDYLLYMRWRDRGAQARLKTLKCYLEGLLALLEDVESGFVSRTATITGTSYFFSARSARRLGFRVEESRCFALGGFLTYPVQFLAYAFAKGRWAFPNILHTKRASISGDELILQKERLEVLLKQLRNRRHTGSLSDLPLPQP